MSLKSPVTFFLAASFIVSFVPWIEADSGCDFSQKHKESPEETQAFKKLKPLLGKRFSAFDQSSQYRYEIGLCVAANTDPSTTELNDDGVIQFEKNGTTWRFIASVGKFTNSQIMGGTDWVLLEYGNGKSYGSHCTNENRRALLMFTCDEAVPVDKTEIVVVGENKEKVSECFYLFEIATEAVCQTKSSVTFSLSFGSILVIIFFSVASLYLILGFLYNRFVLGAKGLEQIPNYSFWQDFGNLQSDGCSLVCRSRGNSGPRTYKGIGDDQLQEEEERDDHLLPM